MSLKRSVNNLMNLMMEHCKKIQELKKPKQKHEGGKFSDIVSKWILHPIRFT